jgi:hypothetical protein
MTDERRGTPRHSASFAGEIETPEGHQKIAITRDVSANGVLLLTRTNQLVVGEPVKLRVMVGHEEVHISGRVVRQEPLGAEESTLWRTKVAVTLDPSPQFEKLMTRAITERPKTER